MGFASGELQADAQLCCDGVCPASGWSLECLQDWGSFFRLAIPSMLMLCMEWWAYEIGSFLSGQCGRGAEGAAGGGGGPCPEAWHQRSLSSGILGMVELGAQSIVYELATIVFMVSV